MNLHTPKLRVVVFGGTGHYGQFIVESLLDHNAVVTVVSRSKSKARAVLGESVHIIEGDVRDFQTLNKALAGQEVVVIALSSMKWKLIKYQKEIEREAVLKIIELAEETGVDRLIYLSGYEIREDILKKLSIEEFGAIKLEIERRLANSSLDYTILGCAPSFKLFFSLLRKNTITIPGGGRNPFPTVSGEDVGVITAQTALMKNLLQRRFRLTGDNAYSVPEVAELMSEISGKKIGHRSVPLFVIRAISAIVNPFNPYISELFKSLKLLNNFPKELALQVPDDFALLQKTFNYKSRDLKSAIQEFFESGTS